MYYKYRLKYKVKYFKLLSTPWHFFTRFYTSNESQFSYFLIVKLSNKCISKGFSLLLIEIVSMEQVHPFTFQRLFTFLTVLFLVSDIFVYISYLLRFGILSAHKYIICIRTKVMQNELPSALSFGASGTELRVKELTLFCWL